jgi:hypothetical protein
MAPKPKPSKRDAILDAMIDLVVERGFHDAPMHMGAAARRVPTRELPDWIVRFFALFISDMKMIAPERGNKKNVSNEKAKRVLGWVPRSNEEAIAAVGESLAHLGLLKK